MRLRSIVLAECGCGARLFHASLKTVRSSPTTHMALMRQALSQHVVATGCQQGSKAMIKIGEPRAASEDTVASALLVEKQLDDKPVSSSNE
jgi:hypothetical protein